MIGLPRFKTDSTRLRENLPGLALKNFLELERVLGALASAFDALQSQTTKLEQKQNILAGNQNAYGCWVVNSNSVTEEDFQYTTPCLNLNADLEVADDADILILD